MLGITIKEAQRASLILSDTGTVVTFIWDLMRDHILSRKKVYQ